MLFTHFFCGVAIAVSSERLDDDATHLLQTKVVEARDDELLGSSWCCYKSCLKQGTCQCDNPTRTNAENGSCDDRISYGVNQMTEQICDQELGGVLCCGNQFCPGTKWATSTTTTPAPTTTPTTTTAASTTPTTTPAATTAAPDGGEVTTPNDPPDGTDNPDDGTCIDDDGCFAGFDEWGFQYECRSAEVEAFCNSDSAEGFDVGFCCPDLCKTEAETKNKEGRDKKEAERKAKREAARKKIKADEAERKKKNSQKEFESKRKKDEASNKKSEDELKNKRKWTIAKKKKGEELEGGQKGEKGQGRTCRTETQE